jgi:hypothetical protein
MEKNIRGKEKRRAERKKNSRVMEKIIREIFFFSCMVLAEFYANRNSSGYLHLRRRASCCAAQQKMAAQEPVCFALHIINI